MAVIEGSKGVWYAAKYLGDGQALTYNASGHDKGATARSRRAKASIYGACHGGGILQPTFASDSIGAARIDDDSTDTLAFAVLKHVPADRHRSGLKFILGKYGSSRARTLGIEKGKIWEGFVGGFDTNMSAGNEETVRVCATAWDILLLG